MTNHQNKSFIFHGEGGAADGAYPIESLRYIVQQSRLEPYQLYDTFIGESVSAIMCAALTIPHPDDPTRPKYTMEEYAGMFYSNVSSYIPYSPNHYKAQIRDKFLTAFRSNDHPRLYDPANLEEGLKGYCGDARLDQTIKSVFISSQMTGPGKPGPYWFTHLKSELLEGAMEPLRFPEIRVPIYKPIMASAACPTVFPAYFIEETGTTHIDAATYSSPTYAVMKLKKNLRPDLQLSYAFFSTGDRSSPLTAVQHNRLNNIVDMVFSRRLTGEIPKIQIKGDSLEVIRLELGEDNVHVFEPDTSPGSTLRGVSPPQNLLDSTHEAMAQRRAFAQEYIHENRASYLAHIDELVENFHRRAQPEPTAAFVPVPVHAVAAEAQQQAGWLSTLFHAPHRLGKFFGKDAAQAATEALPDRLEHAR